MEKKKYDGLIVSIIGKNQSQKSEVIDLLLNLCFKEFPSSSIDELPCLDKFLILDQTLTIEESILLKKKLNEKNYNLLLVALDPSVSNNSIEMETMYDLPILSVVRRIMEIVHERLPVKYRPTTTIY